jgi:hypothetical protein
MPGGLHVLLGLFLPIAMSGVAAAQEGLLPPSSDICGERPEYRQLDFWVGAWDVTAGDYTIAMSRVQPTVGGCLILEEYAQEGGYSSKSISVFDAVLGRWRQTGVDSSGSVSEFTGELSGGAMRLAGETHRPDGAIVLRRMTLDPLGPDRVRQYSERSLDGGATWEVDYEFMYVRRDDTARGPGDAGGQR